MDPNALNSMLERAGALCAARSDPLTAARRQVLGLVAAAERPIGAYELLRRLAQSGRPKATPTTVYRALDFLLKHQLIHRIESASAFVACEDPGTAHSAQFILCDGCGVATELHDDGLTDSLNRLTQRLGYRVARQIIEVRGICPACQTIGTP